MKKENLTAIIIFIISFIIYSFTINHSISIVLDAANYTQDIALDRLVWHPHHLVYHIAFYYWNALLEFIGIEDIVTRVASINVLFGSMSVSIVYLILKKRFNLSTINSIVFSALPSFAYGFWIVSVSVNVYAASLFFLLLLFYIYTSDNDTKSKWLMMGLIHSIAIIFNQWNIFIIPVVMLSGIFNTNRRLIYKKYIYYYLFSLALFTGASYFGVIFSTANIGGVDDILKWLTRYSSIFEWSTEPKKIIIEAFTGISRTIISPYWLFGSEWFTEIFSKKYTGNVSIEEEIFFGRNFSGFHINALLTFTAIAAIGVITMIIILIKNYLKIIKQYKANVGYLTLWLIIPSIMPLFWSGYNLRYWFIQTTIFFILSVVSISFLKNKFFKYFIYIIIISIATVNFFGIMKPASTKNNDLIYHKTMEILNIAEKGDLIIHNDIWTYDSYIDIYSDDILQAKLIKIDNKGYLDELTEIFNKTGKILNTNKIIVLKGVYEKIDSYPKSIKNKLIRLYPDFQNIKYKKKKFQEYFIIDMSSR